MLILRHNLSVKPGHPCIKCPWPPYILYGTDTMWHQSLAKIYQALPPLFFRAGSKLYVELSRRRRQSLETRLHLWHQCVFLGQKNSSLLLVIWFIASQMVLIVVTFFISVPTVIVKSLDQFKQHIEMKTKSTVYWLDAIGNGTVLAIYWRSLPISATMLRSFCSNLDEIS